MKIFWKLDGYLSRVMKSLSYIPAGCLLIVAVIATVNVITSKLFHWSVPSVNDWIEYFLIPIVYLSLAYVQLDRGMISVDFLSKRLPKWFNNTLNSIWDVIFAFFSFYIAHNMYGLMLEQISLHKRSSVLAGSFPLWPMAMILGLGMALYGVCILWTVIRRYMPPLADPAGREEETEKEDDAQ